MKRSSVLLVLLLAGANGCSYLGRGGVVGGIIEGARYLDSRDEEEEEREAQARHAEEQRARDAELEQFRRDNQKQIVLEQQANRREENRDRSISPEQFDRAADAIASDISKNIVRARYVKKQIAESKSSMVLTETSATAEGAHANQNNARLLMRKILNRLKNNATLPDYFQVVQSHAAAQAVIDAENHEESILEDEEERAFSYKGTVMATLSITLQEINYRGKTTWEVQYNVHTPGTREALVRNEHTIK